MVSTMEDPKSSAVTFVNWNSRDSGNDISNLCESDLSNRMDGQIETSGRATRPRQKKEHRSRMKILGSGLETYKSWDSDCTDCKTVHDSEAQRAAT